METSFETIDPPELVSQETLYFEGVDGSRCDGRFIHFRWHDRAYWLLGKGVWRNKVRAGYVYLRLPRGRKLFRSAIGLHTDYVKTHHVMIGTPNFRCARHHPAFVFVGFHPPSVFDIDFLREESARLSSLPYQTREEINAKIERPPRGKVV